MATQKGTFVVWGNGTSVTSGAVTSSYHQSADYSLNGAEKEIKDATGETKSLVLSDDRHELTIEVIPYSASNEAGAQALFNLPTRGDKVVIACTSESTAAEIAGNWIFISGSKRLTNTDEGRLTLNLRRYTQDIA